MNKIFRSLSQTLHTMKKRAPQKQKNQYRFLIEEIGVLLIGARRNSARSINVFLTSTYWGIGKRIVEFEQSGKLRALYGGRLLLKLAHDLTRRFGRGFSVDNLETMRLFYLAYAHISISETSSRKLSVQKSETSSRKFMLSAFAERFPLSWSHYVLLVRKVNTPEARAFYESESLYGGWSVRNLDRQISTQFFERMSASKNKQRALTNNRSHTKDVMQFMEDGIKDPFVLEFLNLKDEYSESDFEASLINNLEQFLLELGTDFAFVGRQKRLQIGNEWYRVDLLFFHRRLRCLVIVDLKVGKFTHADAGQMHMYLNYAREHWIMKDENPPVGLILCAQKDTAVAKYALADLPSKILAAEYKLILPSEKILIQQLQRTQRTLRKR